jgi:nucleoside-diphosphate-sugar epimerase
MKNLFCFGFGYCAEALAVRLKPMGWAISGTSKSADGVDALKREGWNACLFDGSTPSEGARRALQAATHVLVSAPPDDQGDPVLRHHASDLAAAPHLTWIGYLSTIGVYGDRQGAWVDEASQVKPANERSLRRMAAENDWLAFGKSSGKKVEIFRLAGIYGPGRSALDSLKDGTARRIIKPGQVFNRIHVADIASVLAAAMSGRGRHAIYNVTDDEPASPSDVITFAAKLLGMEPPPDISIMNAGLSPMAASFYAENKRVRNTRIKKDLGVALLYPTYREGLRALAAQQA